MVEPRCSDHAHKFSPGTAGFPRNVLLGAGLPFGTSGHEAQMKGTDGFAEKRREDPNGIQDRKRHIEAGRGGDTGLA
jgi:hypothetical protein